MAYTPDAGDAINADLLELYTPPSGDAIIFAIPYGPPHGYAINFDFSGEYVPPAGDAIYFGGVPPGPVDPEDPVVPDPDPALPPDDPTKAVKVGGQQVPWAKLPVVDAKTGGAWGGLRSVSRTIQPGWLRMRVANSPRTSSGWETPPPKNTQRTTSWDRLEVVGRHVGSSWKSLGVSDRKLDAPWGETRQRLGRSWVIYYLYPPRKHRRYDLAFARAQVLDPKPFDVPWGNPPPKDKWHRTLWGPAHYREICWRTYEPPAGDAIAFNLDHKISQVGDGVNINFLFDQYTYDRRCRHREPSGWRDAYFYHPISPVPAGLFKRAYIMMSQVFLTRLPERTPIDVHRVALSADVDSWGWELGADLGSVAALDLLRPGAPVEVEASINGHLWVVQVEGWRQGQRFVGGTRAVSGRSLSAQLAAPAAAMMTYTETEVRMAQQLAQAIIDEVGGGWTLDWRLVDWLVAGNSLSYHNQAPMQVLQTIAAAAGGIVQSHMATKTVIVMPRRGAPPWTWSSATPDVIIPGGMAVQADGEWIPGKQHNAAFVSGTGPGGISAKITRVGTAGDVAAPMITDALITTTEAALARGRHILGESGNWERRQLMLPVFASPGIPGVLLPGQMLQVADGASTWMGQVVGVTVRADRSSGAVSVRQMVDVERYHGN